MTRLVQHQDDFSLLSDNAIQLLITILQTDLKSIKYDPDKGTSWNHISKLLAGLVIEDGIRKFQRQEEQKENEVEL